MSTQCLPMNCLELCKNGVPFEARNQKWRTEDFYRTDRGRDECTGQAEKENIYA